MSAPNDKPDQRENFEAHRIIKHSQMATFEFERSKH